MEQTLSTAALLTVEGIVLWPTRCLTAAGGNYRLQSTSPAIGNGTNLGVTTDLDGKPRTTRWDIGAYQYFRSLFSAGSC